MSNVKLHLNYAGHCFAKEHHAIQGGRRQDIKFQALWGLIEHPTQGYVLYDTGYTDRFFEATRYFPNKIYALATKVVLEQGDSVKSQLAAHGIAPLEIKHIIITHFHADHVGGLRDFPNATLHASRAALEQALTIPRAISFSKGILKDLLPHDLKERTVVFEDNAKLIEDTILGPTYDLFGDGTLRIVPLPGHAAGQVGLLLSTERRTYFLIADACWMRRSYEEMILPSPLVKLFFHSWSDFKLSLGRVHEYHKQHPDVVIVPTHCEESTLDLVASEIDMDAL